MGMEKRLCLVCEDREELDLRLFQNVIGNGDAAVYEIQPDTCEWVYVERVSDDDFEVSRVDASFVGALGRKNMEMRELLGL